MSDEMSELPSVANVVSEVRPVAEVAKAYVKQPLRLVDPSVSPVDDSITWEDIQNATDITLGYVEVPEWGRMPDGSPKKAYLKILSARESLDMAKRVTDPAKKADALLELVQRCLVNPKTMESIVPPAGISTFEKRSIVVFRRLQDGSMELNGMGDEVKEQEAAKNA